MDSQTLESLIKIAGYTAILHGIDMSQHHHSILDIIKNDRSIRQWFRRNLIYKRELTNIAKIKGLEFIESVYELYGKENVDEKKYIFLKNKIQDIQYLKFKNNYKQYYDMFTNEHKANLFFIIDTETKIDKSTYSHRK